MNIRRAQKTDVIRLAQIEKLQPFSAQWGVEGWKSELENAFAQVWCAEEDGEVIGFVSVRAAAGLAEILNVALDPAFCRRGKGQMLLAHVLKDLKTHNVAEVTLEVNECNGTAVSFYTKAGLVVRGRREKFYHQTDDALIMGKEL